MNDTWPYVLAAYSVTMAILAGLCVGMVLTLQRWARRAREEEQR